MTDQPAAAQTTSMRWFVIFLAAIFAMGSLGIDAVLPAYPAITRDLRLDNPDHIQFLVTSFALGMGLGNLIGGPLSDSKGRKGVILLGCVLYMLGAVGAALTSTLPAMLAFRFLQGIGAALATVAATALIRDLYSGNAMARIMSFATMIFAMMPAVAPFLGQFIAALLGWRMIFVVFAAFGLILVIATFVFAQETLRHERSGLSLSTMYDRAREVFGFPEVRRAIAAQTLNFAVLLSMLSSIQPIFDKAFQRAESFPSYFAIMALAIGGAGFLNARIVSNIGADRLTRWGFAGGSILAMIAMTLLYFSVSSGSTASFVIFLVWAAGTFFMYGFTTGNLNALAMEPVGHVAGMASSLITSIPLIMGTALSIPVSLAFDGTPRPLIVATALFTTPALILLYYGRSRRAG